MNRQILLILIAGILCFIAGPTPPVAADKLCPPVLVPAGGWCNCTVYNYGDDADKGVVIEMCGGSDGCKSTTVNTIDPHDGINISWPFGQSGWSSITCKVKGDGGHSRVAMQCFDVYENMWTFFACSN
jgi:hypothetical protein